MEEFIEEAMDKTNAQLFQELLRFYPTAEAEDYFKLGQWRNDTLKTDLQLLAAHRFEAGAPDPPPIEDVKMPELPPGALNPVVPSVRPVLPGVGVVRPTLLPGGQGVTAVKPPGAVASATGPTAELRLIALFVAKWKLDPSQTKQLLAKLTPARRRYIIQNFKHVGKEGEGATPALKEYIEKCEKEGTWPAADAAAPPPAATALGAVKAATTTVRPLVVKPSPIVPKPVGKAVTPAATSPAGAKRPAFGAAVAGTAPAAATAPAGAKRPAAWVNAGANSAAAAEPKRPKFGAAVVEPPKVGGWAANAKAANANAAKWTPTPKPAVAKPGQWGSAVRPAGAGKAPSGALISGLLKKF